MSIISLPCRRLLSGLQRSYSLILRAKLPKSSYARSFFDSKPTFLASSGSHSITEDGDLPLRYLFLRTSIDMWEESPHGVTYDVGYQDSQPAGDFSPKIPTILGLPGIMGSHKELSDLLLPLAKLGYRILIPNLPGNKYTRGLTQPDEDIFTYSIEERAEFIKDFLAELEVPRSMQPISVFRGIAKIWDSPFLRVFMKCVLFLVKPFTKKRRWKVKEIITFSRLTAGTSYEEVEELIHAAKSDQTPRFFVISDNDRLYERELMDELVEKLGVPESSLQVFDDSKSTAESDINKNASDVKSSAIDVQNVQGVKFLGGKGDIKETKSSHLKQLLWDFMRMVRPGS